MDKINYSLIDPIIIQDPKITYSEFTKRSAIKISDVSFYNRKKRILNSPSPSLNPSNYLEKFTPGTKTYKLIKILIDNPKGINIDVVSESLKMSTKSICDIIGRLKNRRKMSINRNGNLIFISETTEQTSNNQPEIKQDSNQSLVLVSPQTLVPAEKLPKQGTLLYKTLETLTIYKETGISIDKLQSELKVERTSIYYLIHHLKKKGINIHSVNGIYKIKPSKMMVKSQQTAVNTDVPHGKVLLELSSLPDSDLSDALQHMKLAHFHGAVYRAIIESNTIVARLEKAIQSERDQLNI